MKKMTCGAGKKCSKELCGPGEHPSIPPGGGEHLKPGGCKSVRVARMGGLVSWCKNTINHGYNCPALYGHFYGFCLDFCCDFVFSTCKCNCCECLQGAGGTCIGESCTSVSCPLN